MPVLYPANVQEYLDFGLHGWAMSRYSGCWVAFKALADTGGNLGLGQHRPAAVNIVSCPTDFPCRRTASTSAGPTRRWQEARLLNHKLYAALAYCRANRLDR